MSRTRRPFEFLICLLLVVPAWAGHTLTPQEQKIVAAWLSGHPHFRAATDKDCDCVDDLREIRTGEGGVWNPTGDYRPYIATDDFNGDGIRNFAFVVIDRTKAIHQFSLLVFNGPFSLEPVEPTFVASGLDLRYMGLAFGPPRPKPYRLIVGRFGTDNTSMLVPHGQTYKLR